MGENAELARRLYDAFAAGDVAAVLGAMDPGIEWWEAESNPYDPGRPFVGPDDLTQGLLVRLATEWDDFRVHPKEFTETDDGVLVQGRYSGVLKETGKSLDAQFAHVWKVRDGKITAFQQYTDTARMQETFRS